MICLILASALIPSFVENETIDYDRLRDLLVIIRSELQAAELKLDLTSNVDDLVWLWDDPTVWSNIECIFDVSYAALRICQSRTFAAPSSVDDAESKDRPIVTSPAVAPPYDDDDQVYDVYYNSIKAEQ